MISKEPETIYEMNEIKVNHGDTFTKLFYDIPTDREVDYKRIGRILQNTAVNLPIEQLRKLVEYSKAVAISLLEKDNFIAAPSWAALCQKLDHALIVQEKIAGLEINFSNGTLTNLSPDVTNLERLKFAKDFFYKEFYTEPPRTYSFNRGNSMRVSVRGSNEDENIVKVSFHYYSSSDTTRTVVFDISNSGELLKPDNFSKLRFEEYHYNDCLKILNRLTKGEISPVKVNNIL